MYAENSATFKNFERIVLNMFQELKMSQVRGFWITPHSTDRQINNSFNAKRKNKKIRMTFKGSKFKRFVVMSCLPIMSWLLCLLKFISSYCHFSCHFKHIHISLAKPREHIYNRLTLITILTPAVNVDKQEVINFSETWR